MKYCTKCGNQVNEDAVICVKCGCQLANDTPKKKVNKDKDFYSFVTSKSLANGCSIALLVISTINLIVNIIYWLFNIAGRIFDSFDTFLYQGLWGYVNTSLMGICIALALITIINKK